LSQVNENVLGILEIVSFGNESFATIFVLITIREFIENCVP